MTRLLPLLACIAAVLAALSLPESWQRGTAVVGLILWIRYGVRS